jgi:hypothetical protein
MKRGAHKRLETDHSIKPDLQTNIRSGSKEDKEALRKTDLRLSESISRYKQYRKFRKLCHPGEWEE